jgi:hypothetical protein
MMLNIHNSNALLSGTFMRAYSCRKQKKVFRVMMFESAAPTEIKTYQSRDDILATVITFLDYIF